ncbi:DUF445 domain-containing protein [Tenacibaculum finnmarkense]|uniref:DUF445 domain-containing protein n=1 Tax=Tenacibaculum finnmarkense genomovar ulcerans TaxID=2781388 RepID=A0A2I2M872_9FLAO|nr:DUF445 domain-containing protein [Tenacibaculum finnmarkense]MBE7644629.1 DUF445 family protein [Tenacibaculum finnmarkense genomovar ulcerans]MBE7697075.1 DUF445 family protein [Tenacibaculum finnmarkense genomovar ulcerans]MCG8235419.1 DUF445 domain-containing protein [Tenacibaculum finnmarkense genomovar ulcerans]MCG8829550.1 DUF445 domain-containing protein [Tenacibaculum finnmarkense]SOU88745.1 conserved membrane hypothetical protein [Tenacibaculum finnmarkense genomovar ulcerans]
MKLPKKGALSLAIATLGMLLLIAGIKTEFLTHIIWHILLAGFEAAVVGGCADWFAVRALFAEIPIPLISKHSNIIVKSRAKLSNGIVDLVSNEWLSKESLADKIKSVAIADKIVAALKEEKNVSKIIHFLQDILLQFSKNTDFSKLTPYLEKMLKKELQGIELGKPLGIWLQKALKNQEHSELWKVALSSVSKTINSDETRNMLVENIANQSENLKKESTFKLIAVKTAQKFGGLNNESIADKLVKSINDLLDEIAKDKQHPLRKRLENELLDFAQKLEIGNLNALASIQNMQEKLIGNIESKSIVSKLVNSLQNKLQEQLNDDKSVFIEFIKQKSTQIISDFSKNTELIEKADASLKKLLVSTIHKNHHLIANTVSESLENLNNEDLVKQIEDKVGDDLQYIRLNGAIVGGVVGMILYIIKTTVLNL